jgi:hypothetical protein
VSFLKSLAAFSTTRFLGFSMWPSTYLVPALWGSFFLHSVFVAAEVSPSDGCSAPFQFPATPGNPSKPLKVGDRIIRVALPKNYKQDVPAPLILAYHDRDQRASDMEEVSSLSDPSSNTDTIIVYPEAAEVSTDPKDCTMYM